MEGAERKGYACLARKQKCSYSAQERIQIEISNCREKHNIMRVIVNDLAGKSTWCIEVTMVGSSFYIF